MYAYRSDFHYLPFFSCIFHLIFLRRRTKCRILWASNRIDVYFFSRYVREDRFARNRNSKTTTNTTICLFYSFCSISCVEMKLVFLFSTFWFEAKCVAIHWREDFGRGVVHINQTFVFVCSFAVSIEASYKLNSTSLRNQIHTNTFRFDRNLWVLI